MTTTVETCEYCRLWFGRVPPTGTHDLWRQKLVHWHLYGEARAIKNRRRVDATVTYTEPFAVARTPGSRAELAVAARGSHRTPGSLS